MLCKIYLMRTIHIPQSELYFTFARSSGAGGQNVNKVSSKAQLRWNPFETTVLTDEEKLRFAALFQSKLNSDGTILISSEQFRDQPRNIQDCLDKLKAMIAQAKTVPKRRRKTRPTKASQIKRVDNKKRHGEKKRLRGKFD